MLPTCLHDFGWQERMNKMKDNSIEKNKGGLVTPVKYTEVPYVEVSWLWEPFIPLGDVTIVEGDGMTGKTTAMIRLASMVTKGEIPPTTKNGEMLESQKTDPANVLYIGVEANNETEIKPAIKYGKGDSDRIFFLDQSNASFVLDEDYVREAIEKTNCKLVIIDPYTNFLPKKVNNTNATAMRLLLTKLMHVARDTNTAIVLIGHLSKSPYGKLIYSGYGSADIVNTVRSVLLFDIDDRGNHFLRILKSNYFGVDPSFKVALCMDDDYCVQFEDYNLITYIQKKEEQELAGEYGNGKTEPETKTGRCKEVLKEILANGPMPKSDVIKLIESEPENFGSRTISRAFTGMGGISYFEGRTGYWKLPEQETEE